jgi:hypothetical protein
MGAKPSSCILNVSLYIMERRAIRIFRQLQPLMIYCRYQDDILTNLHIAMMPVIREIYMQVGLTLTITMPTIRNQWSRQYVLTLWVSTYTEFFNKSSGLFPRDDHLQHNFNSGPWQATQGSYQTHIQNNLRLWEISCHNSRNNQVLPSQVSTHRPR